jgi:hypothetical protein
MPVFKGIILIIRGTMLQSFVKTIDFKAMVKFSCPEKMHIKYCPRFSDITEVP